ncbi:MAG: endolytic transglycosylase MltG, partial [Balneolaceae bacterium]|nr:endolytic transglycosylase MltG [Balneolaceae bacterium]
RGMPLQADPTVLYALGERRRLLFEDYQYQHPYNTYLYRGLPPGPITNPDEASINAVLNPEDHGYYYMVATPDGTHRFSRTFEEHRQASDEWRRWIREQYRIRDQREREESAAGAQSD